MASNTDPSKMNESNETSQETSRNPLNFAQLENTCKTNYLQGKTKKEFSRNRICLRFLIGACYKNNCRYPHISKLKSIVFCHDYQNSECHRDKCKFLHYSIQEEEYFRKHGKFADFCDYEGDFRCNGSVIFGHCKHSKLKRDRHDFDPKWNDRMTPVAATSSLQTQSNLPSGSYPSNFTYRPNYFNERMVLPEWPWHNSVRNQAPDRFDEYRDFSLDHDCSKAPKLDTNRTNYENTRYNQDLDIIAMIRRFQEDQTLLRQRVEANEMKISELRACNEHLLAQLAQYRMGSVQCSRVVNPVTVTNTSTQPQGQTAQVINAVSMAPVQVQATPIVSIAAPQTQIIASNGTPLAITNTSQGQQLAALAQQSLSTLSTSTELLGPPQQILSTSQITLAPALQPAPSMGLTINTSQALAMSNATQPIISYPIMTHSILPH